MKIVISKLQLTNFKGIKSLEVVFKHITDIFGENAAGKTTIFDAFTWLFFGKDSTDRKDFELKPLDKFGKAIEKVDVEVSATIEIDSKAIQIRKVLREKWVTKRGDIVPVFAGNENLFYWNDVPLQLKQFQDKINDLLNESIFKLITNPLYFNTLKWQERREVLLAIAGNISVDELTSINPEFKKLVILLGDKTLEEFKREMAARKKKIKDDLHGIPTRIDELFKQMPEEIDFNSLRNSIEEKQLRLAAIDDNLQSAIKSMEKGFEEKRNAQTVLHELNSKASNIKNEVRSSFSDSNQERKNGISDLERKISAVQFEITSKQGTITEHSNNIIAFRSEKDGIATEWEMENASAIVFDADLSDCPACHQQLPADKVDNSKATLTESFNTSKARKLSRLFEKGSALKVKIEGKTTLVEDLKVIVASLKKEFTQFETSLLTAKESHKNILANAEKEFNVQLSNHLLYNSTLNKISELENAAQEPAEAIDNSELKAKKAVVNIELDAAKKLLTNEDRINQTTARIKELQEEEKQLAQQLANVEGNEYLTEQFTKAKIDMLVSRINGKFKHVSFKMFDTQINGGEVEICDTLVNGVPFTDANNAAKINSGLDIINTLCEHYGVYAPIFIDNRESVNKLIDCNSQVVNLIVSNDKKLRVA